MYLTAICQKNQTYNAMLTTNSLTCLSRTPVKDMKPVKKLLNYLANNKMRLGRGGGNIREINGTFLSERSDQNYQMQRVGCKVHNCKHTPLPKRSNYSYI